eukprot:TRINITY_DN32750_c1_g1_i11.p2 TRINITY_DN32750_c1_g1~~TRINITY_DN32750_c1_g1_i11.p2  ORF type:complete len:102 (+),score=4.62 TRINITY_DN32750_c1_g1_i11:152-457(+)
MYGNQSGQVYVQVIFITEIGRFGIKHAYNSELLDVYRDMISTHKARWDPDEQVWTFPEEYEASVVDIIRKHDFVTILDKRLAREIPKKRSPFSAFGASPYA